MRARLDLVLTKPEVGLEWWNTHTVEGGGDFFNRRHSEIVQRVRAHKLYDAYQLASSCQVHCQIMGLGQGLALTSGPDNHTFRLRYQDSTDRVMYAALFCIYQRFYRRVLAVVPSIFPEIVHTDVVEIAIPQYGRQVDALFDALAVHMSKRSGRPGSTYPRPHAAEDLSRLAQRPQGSSRRVRAPASGAIKPRF